MEVVEQVRARGGAVRRARLPRRQVERALEAGLLVAPRPGVVADPALWPTVLAAVALGGLLSCAAAARAHRVDLIDPVTTVHVTVPRSRHTRAAEPAVVVHRRDAPSLDGLATTLARTAADCARCLPPRDALVVVDQVLARGVERDEVLAHLQGAGRRAAPALVLRGSAVSGSMGRPLHAS